MYRDIKNIIFFSFLIFLFQGCSDTFDIPIPPTDKVLNGELVVEFDLLVPEVVNSRSFAENEDVKTKFKSGDLIHIIGTFNTQYLKEDGSYETGDIVRRYGALRYNGRLWEPVEGSTLTWPTNSTDGQFEAYFIAESNGVLTSESPIDTKLLSYVSPSSDPLHALSKSGIKYGYGVPLEFKHLCSYLSLVDLEPMVSENYMFTSSGVKESEYGASKVFHNAFQISLADIYSAQGPKLNFEFIESPDSDYGGLVYIKGDVSEIEKTGDNGEIIVTTRANYFLEPGFYETFRLLYPAGENSTYNYLEYNYKNVPDDSGGVGITNNPPLLKAATTYTLTITKSPGITIITPSEPGGWDETGQVFEVNVEEFLKSVNQGTEYWYVDENNNRTQILEVTPIGVRLLHNVNFKFYNYKDFEDKSFRPNTNGDMVFDGGLHYIHNIGSPLIYYNYGTIQNLGIKTARIDLISEESDNEADDMSRNGAFCKWNRSSGTISNVRVNDIDLKVYVKSTDEEGNEVHNIGGILGSNTGTVREVSVAGHINVNVAGLTKDIADLGDGKDYPVNAQVLIGGIVGQNAGEGDIYDVTPLEGVPSIKISNSCVGPLGAYSVGGLVGESQGYVTGVILTNITVDSSQSKGVASYIGGIAGQLSVSTDSGNSANANITSNNVSGTVKAGMSNPSLAHPDVSSVNYIGGITGTVLNVPITDCNVSVSVYASQDVVEKVTYGTGGAIGRIRNSNSYNIADLIAYGNYLQYPPGQASTTGSFAGIAAPDQTWADYANKNIIVHTYSGIGYIGSAF